MTARATTNMTGRCGAGAIPSGVSNSALATGSCVGTLGAVVAELVAVGALGGGGAQIDSGCGWDQVKEGGNLAIKRGGLDRVHSSDGHVSSLKGDGMNVGGRKYFVDAITDLFILFYFI